MPTDAQTPLLNGDDCRRTWSGERAPQDAPPTEGTVQASSINLAACALGASMLSLPYTMLVSGAIISLEFLLLFAIMAYASSQAIISAGIATKKSTYSAIAYHYFGSACGIFVDILLSIALLVAAISYIVGLADLLPVSCFTPFLSYLLDLFLAYFFYLMVTFVLLTTYFPLSSSCGGNVVCLRRVCCLSWRFSQGRLESSSR